jgi:trk system potassium uptake protein TrkH
MKKEVSGYRLVFGYLGIFIMFEGLVTLIPLFMCFYPGEWQCWLDFFIPGFGAIVLGACLYFPLIAGHPKAHFGKNDDSLLLILLWVFAFVIGAMPFYLAGIPALNGGKAGLTMTFTESFFEAVSGYTATGLTIFTSFLDSSVQYCSHVFLFHRALMQFVGGIGLVLIVAGALSDRYNLKLYFAEGHNDKLMPNLGRSAKLIFGIYFGYIILGTVSLWMAGMDVFDALCHSIAALATGGFSTRNTGFVYYQTVNGTNLNGIGIFPVNALAMEIISMVLMCLGATNFVLHTFLFRGKWKQFFKDIEIKLAIFVIIFFTFATAISSMYLYTGGRLSFAQSLRYSVFNVVSSITTTGFINAPSINALGEVAVFCGILLMGIGGGVGSTSGGIKQYRLGILFKDFVYSIRYRFSSSRTINPNPVYRLGELKEEDPATSDEAHNYAVLYIVVFLVGSLVLAYLPAVKFDQAIYDFMSALSGTGLDVINFVSYKAAQPLAYPWLLIILDIGMIFGRLEILPIFFAFQRVTVDSVENVKHNRNRAVKEA